MPSVINGYEYDIFISYRHNDNRSGWVTHFVNALQEELAATIKEPLSIYFDKNPHDGLLETHHVDKSLEGKLKCLIFIPIVSQTYCDSKSFAWQHEFCAFNQLAKEDQFGRDIKLNNGNVASRILPIKIHDLDAADQLKIEHEIDGVLRAIEFIFKSPGVNRPLRAIEDHLNNNQNKTFYHDQINKVANAVKDLISAVQQPNVKNSTSKVISASIAKSRRKRITTNAMYLLIFGLIGYSFFYFVRPRLKLNPTIDKSIAVLPFTDMSPNHDQEYFGDGVAEEIINVLTHVNDLKVIARTSSFQFKGKNEDLRKIGEMLDVSTVLEGSVRKSKDKIRITAQLIKTSDGAHLWSKTYDRNADDVFKVQDEIALAIVEAFKVTLANGLKPSKPLTNNDEAYNAYLEGKYFLDRAGMEDTEKAMNLFQRAAQLDSTFALAWIKFAVCKWRISPNANSEGWKIAKAATERGLALDPNLAEGHVNLSFLARSNFDFVEVDKQIAIARSIDSKNAFVLRNVGFNLVVLGRFDEGIELIEQAIVIDPIQPIAQIILYRAYYYSGRLDEAIELSKKVRELNPNFAIALGMLDEINLVMIKNGPQAVLQLIASEKNEVITLSGKAIAFQKLGQKEESDRAFAKLNDTYSEKYPYEIAQVYASRNEKENALKFLERAYLQKEQSLSLIKVDPVFVRFHDAPRFVEILKKMNFPQ